MSNYSLLVCSCDYYEEIWDPFFFLLDKYWPNVPTPIYLLTEQKEYIHKNVITLKSEGPWSNRLLDAVNRINSEFVMLLLDDFFLLNSVDSEEINRLVSLMSEQTDVAVFYFKHSTPQTSTNPEFNSYIKMDNSLKYIVNFQAGLWRISALRELIEKNKTPWEIEENKEPVVPSRWRLYCPIKSSYTSCEGDVVPYLWALESGYGVCKGRMLWNSIKQFKKEGIDYTPINLKPMSKIEYIRKRLMLRILNRLDTIRGMMHERFNSEQQ